MKKSRKGFGKDHTKFSPGATAAYRLLPDIKLLTCNRTFSTRIKSKINMTMKYDESQRFSRHFLYRRMITLLIY